MDKPLQLLVIDLDGCCVVKVEHCDGEWSIPLAHGARRTTGGAVIVNEPFTTFHRTMGADGWSQVDVNAPVQIWRFTEVGKIKLQMLVVDTGNKRAVRMVHGDKDVVADLSKRVGEPIDPPYAAYLSQSLDDLKAVLPGHWEEFMRDDSGRIAWRYTEK